MITNIILIVVGLLTTLFIPGFIVIEVFFRRMKFHLKMPLYIIISLLTSVNIIYLLSLIFGFGRHVVLILFFLLLPLFIYLIWTRRKELVTNLRKNGIIILLAFLIGMAFFIPLNNGFFTKLDDGYILSSPNWQDTAMHIGIVESITQGNFPPQAPYYSGRALSYYYFADFHAAIINEMWGMFFPRVMVILNPIFSSTLVLSMFALVYELTRKKLLSWIVSIIAPLFGNYMFFRFLSDIKKLEVVNLETINTLLSKVYSMEYEGLFQVSTMADYFLQNRPMMIGLPVLTIVIVLSIKTQKSNKIRYAILTAILTALLYKFQLFALLCSVVVFLVSSIVYFEKKKIKVWLKLNFIYLVCLFITSLFLFFITQINEYPSVDLRNMLFSAFRWGSWDTKRTLSWHLLFLVANFGIPLLIFIFQVIYYLIRLIRKKTRIKAFEMLIVLTLLFFLVPYSLSFTIYKGDMFKFFYVAEIAMLAGLTVGVSRIFNNLKRVWIPLCLILIISTFTSILTLTGSYLNKNWAYSNDDLFAGLWIRENTPQKSIFINYPAVHSPVSQIGGRLRMLSYINWPYSHGFNRGEDNVFSRVKDVDKFYNSENGIEKIGILDKYNIDYIYLGPMEKYHYPEAMQKLDSSPFLIKEYYNSSIVIYHYVR